MTIPKFAVQQPVIQQVDQTQFSPRRATGRAASSPEWVVLLVLLAASVPPQFLRHRSLIVTQVPNLLDWSWTLDTCYKAATGVWFGRDVAFTYGPLYQWLSSAPARWIGVSTGSILATWNMLPTMVSVLAVFVSLRLLLPQASSWKRALFLAAVFWSPPGIRLALCLLALVIFVRLTDAPASRLGGVALPALVAALICLACFLVSADAGLYSTAALVLCLSATATVKAKMPGAVAELGAFLVATGIYLAVLVVATNAVMASPLNFSYWKSSLTLATGYRWFEAKSISEASTWRMLGALALGSMVFGSSWRRREPDGDRWTLRPAFLLAGFCLAVLMVQSALVRADAIHVVNGIYLMVFLSGAILIGELTNVLWLPVVLLAIMVATAPALVAIYGDSFPVSALRAARGFVRPTLTCPEGKREFDHACFPPTIAQLFATVSTYVDQHTGPGDSLLVFPYQNALGIMSRRIVAGGVMQGYLVNGDYLTEVHLAGLRKANPPFGLYLPDGINSFGVDGVPSFTRSPGTWFYLLRHYRAESSPAPGVVGLVRDDNRDQHLALVEEKITDAVGTVGVTGRETSVNFGQIHWPAAAADFLKFRFRANYSFWWRMRKPSSLLLAMSFADGSWKLLHFVVEPNHDSEVWVYPWNDEQMAGYLSSEDSRGRDGSPLTGLSLRIAPFDWISASPESVSIGAVDAVRVSPK